MISPIRSSFAAATKPLSIAFAGTSTEMSVISPMRLDVALWMARNLPTVARASLDTPACAGSKPIVACEPVTARTRPITGAFCGLVDAAAGIGAGATVEGRNAADGAAAARN